MTWPEVRKYLVLPTVATVVGGVILAALLSEAFRSWLGTVALASGKAVYATWATPVWLLLLLILGSAVAIGRAALDRARSRRAPRPPPHHAYVSDLILGIRWTWRWTPSNHIDHLTPRCPNDGMRLVFAQFSYAAAGMCTARCEKCGDGHEPLFLRYANEDAVGSAALREIERKVTTGEWRDVPTS